MADTRGDDFINTSSQFMTWTHWHGITVSPKISLTDLRNQDAGRGVVAMEDIEEGEELFAIPLKKVLRVETSGLWSILRQELQDLDEWLSLVLVLIYEYGQGEKSPWYRYLNILPTRFDTLAFWAPQELEELQGSAVLSKIGKQEADETFKTKLFPIIWANPDTFAAYSGAATPNNESFLVGLAHSMATLIMAYAFDLEAEQSDTESEDAGSQQTSLPKGMVPLADMLNADGDRNNAHLIQEADSVHMMALKPIIKGEEIFNDYGQIPRTDLLRRYGYVTDRYKKWDVVEVDADLIVHTACQQCKWDEADKLKRSQLAQIWGVIDDGFSITRDAARSASHHDPALLSFLNAFTMDAKTLKEDWEAGEAYQQEDKPRITLEAARLLRQVLIERRNDYQTTIAEDATLLMDQNLRKRHRMAVGVRMGEKEIIAACLENMNRVIYTAESLDIGEEGEDGTPPALPAEEMFNKDDVRVKRRKT